MKSSWEYIEKAIVNIQQGAVLQLGGSMVSKFLTAKTWDVKNCYIRSQTLTDSLIMQESSPEHGSKTMGTESLDWLLEDSASLKIFLNPIWAGSVQVRYYKPVTHLTWC